MDLERESVDDQYLAEILDEESRDDQTPDVHIELMGPDMGGPFDDEAELIGSDESAEGPISPEDAAVHRF